MELLGDLYKPSLALLTDLYELTMAYGYWKTGLHERRAAFHLFFRENPFRGGFAVACGLASVVDYLERLRFDEADVDYLAGLRGGDGTPLFDRAFLDALASMRFACDVDAVPEGTVVIPNEPLVRVVGPLIKSQIVETALLNLVNFQTLIATKAARIVAAARGDPVFDFGLRRAQGIDGGLSAGRAAYVGGCAGTSNVLAGRLYGIPVKGTHAHSWIMCFDDEPQAFQAYAEAMPNNCVFLVDTYDSIQGVKNAVEAGRRLRERGHRMIGIRLDSGELGPLSVEARRILDEAGFSDAIIFASNDLDEHRIARLKQQGAAVGVWGVGTRLVTAFDDPALGGVYKLTAVENDEGRWQDRLKISEETIKTSIPGILQVRRFFEGGRAAGDVLYDRRDGIQGDCTAIDRVDPARRSTFGSSAESTDLLVPVLRRGKRVAAIASLDAARERAREQLAQVASAFKRLDEPERYPVGLDERLHDRRARMIEEERGPKP